MRKIIIAILILSLAAPAFAQMRKAIGGTPTMGSCGTTPSVAGKDSGGTVTVGTSIGAGTCTLNFSQTHGSAPSCTATAGSVGIDGLSAVTSTTTIVFSRAGNLSDSILIHYHCMIR